MSDNAVFKKISEYPSVEELSTEQKEAYLNSAEILSIGSTSVGADLTNYRVPLSDIGGGSSSDLPPITPSDEGKFLKVESGAAAWGEGGGGGDDNVYVELGDIEAGIPLGQTSKWDEIAEHLVAGESVVGRVTSSSGTSDAPAITQIDFAAFMSAIHASTLAEMKEYCEERGKLDMLTIKFMYDIEGSTTRVDVTTEAGVYPRYILTDSFVELESIALNMDISLRPTNVLVFKVQDNKYVLDVYGSKYLDDNIEELLRDVLSDCSTCKYTGYMGNTPGESTPSKFSGESIPVRITISEDFDSGNTAIRIEMTDIVQKNSSYTSVPAMWRGDFVFKAMHDHYRYWQTEDTAFELATVNA